MEKLVSLVSVELTSGFNGFWFSHLCLAKVRLSKQAARLPSFQAFHAAVDPQESPREEEAWTGLAFSSPSSSRVVLFRPLSLVHKREKTGKNL